ncbi:MAG: hypothetical protein U0354_05355 [Candidatus Sericytochromatia bacterium]
MLIKSIMVFLESTILSISIFTLIGISLYNKDFYSHDNKERKQSYYKNLTLLENNKNIDIVN